MKRTLSELIRPYHSVSIIGMCKNAGKTTVLNRIIEESTREGVCLGLTSIGRDGEGQDLVTGTKKPGIYVPQGTLIATASDLILRHCDISREILETTGISTPMGDVVIFRARSDGGVQLAGPSMTTQLTRVCRELSAHGARRVLVDGALSRKTLCSRRVTEATILCTGASYHKNLEKVVEDTAYQCHILSLPEIQDGQVRTCVEELGEFRGFVLFGSEGFTIPVNLSLEDALRQQEGQGTHTVFFGGALTDFALKPLLMSNVRLKDLRFVVRDGSKILLKQEIFEKLLRRGVSLFVLDDVNLVGVTVNPFSAYGFHFSKEKLMSAMGARISLPVMDVMEKAV